MIDSVTRKINQVKVMGCLDSCSPRWHQQPPNTWAGLFPSIASSYYPAPAWRVPHFKKTWAWGQDVCPVAVVDCFEFEALPKSNPEQLNTNWCRALLFKTPI